MKEFNSEINYANFAELVKRKQIMKKVLILAYDFPPYVSVGGLRPKAWLDYLSEFDVEPNCSHNSSMGIISMEIIWITLESGESDKADVIDQNWRMVKLLELLTDRIYPIDCFLSMVI